MASNISSVLEWPEPIQRVQELANTGLKTLPPRYIRPTNQVSANFDTTQAPPVVDLSSFDQSMKDLLSSACKEWGVFQVVNHGIPRELLASAMDVSRSFFELPMEEKVKYANDPVSYEGYGSRIGVKKDIILDWNDYFFHHLRPFSATKDYQKWPLQPVDYRKTINEYGERVFSLCKRLLDIFSEDLGLPRGSLLESFGGEDGVGACYRMNYYPKCPQPELALGLAPHTDPGCFTAIFQDQVSGLQVNKDGVWFNVPPVKDALVIILADQLEIVSNGIYKSVDHRTAVNGDKERMSLVVFFNPDGNKKIGPMEALVEKMGSHVYSEMSFNEYRMFIRTLGVAGRTIVATRFTIAGGAAGTIQ
ncbi:jasmonate-induced oxygenase 1-like [Tasmannia lanceolata]|uniref:jasmonate-induced oxygenase 1-like n=1 Tax=Tasmannia lanceolata TaxID=3420 RepID=UPI004062D011